MFTTDYINVILKILQINDFSHLFILLPLNILLPLLKKFLILMVSLLYTFTYNLKSLLLSALITFPIIITYPKVQNLSTLNIFPLTLFLLLLSFLIIDIYVLVVPIISLKTFLFNLTIEKQLFLMLNPLFLK